MLTISKKAASEAECEAICAQSYAQEKPFGCDVIIVDPQQFEPSHSFFAGLFQPSIRSRARAYMYGQLETLVRKDPALVKFVDLVPLFNAAAVDSIANFISASHSMMQENATNGGSMRCGLPSCSILVCSKGENPGNDLFKRSVGIRTNNLPGYDSQWHTMVLWHEIGHACRGMSEEKADQLSALVCRHAFEDFRFLSAWADFRAIQPVLLFENIGMQYRGETLPYRYPANLAFVLDEVILRKEDPSWQDIADTVADRSKPAQICSIQDSLSFAQKLKQQAPNDFKRRNILQLAKAATKIVEENRAETLGELALAARFALAGFRLSAGPQGYSKAMTAPGHDLT